MMKTTTRILAVLCVWAAPAFAPPPKKPIGKTPPALVGAFPREPLPGKAKTKIEECEKIVHSLAKHMDQLLLKEKSVERSIMVVGWQSSFNVHKESWDAAYSAAMKAMNAEYNKDKAQTEAERGTRKFYMDQRNMTEATMDHVFGTVGEKMATWKWKYNQRMANMQLLIDGMPPIIKELHRILAAHDEPLADWVADVESSTALFDVREHESDVRIVERVVKAVQAIVRLRLIGWKAYYATIDPKKIREELFKAKKDWLDAKHLPAGALPPEVIAKATHWDKTMPGVWDAAYKERYKKAGEAFAPLLGERPSFYKDLALFKDLPLADLHKFSVPLRKAATATRARLMKEKNVVKLFKKEFAQMKLRAEEIRKRVRQAARRKPPWQNWMDGILNRLRKAKGVKDDKGALVVEKAGTYLDTVGEAVKRHKAALAEWEDMEVFGTVEEMERKLKSGNITDADRNDVLVQLPKMLAKEAEFRMRVRQAEDDIVKTLEEAEAALEKAGR